LKTIGTKVQGLPEFQHLNEKNKKDKIGLDNDRAPNYKSVGMDAKLRMGDDCTTDA